MLILTIYSVLISLFTWILGTFNNYIILVTVCTTSLEEELIREREFINV